MFYMFLAHGFEETEALATLDLLRRAKIEILTVAVGTTRVASPVSGAGNDPKADKTSATGSHGITGQANFVTGSHGITVKADLTETELDHDSITGVILPGGMPGTNNLWASETVKNCVKSAFENEFPVCAICAAPLILGRLGILNGRKAVCFPGFESELLGAQYTDEKSVTDGHVITAKAAGAVCEFAYNIITAVRGEEAAKAVIEGIYYG